MVAAVVAAVMASSATVMMAFDVVVPFDVAVPLNPLATAAVVTTAAPARAAPARATPAPAPAGPPRHDVGRLVRVGGAVVERGLRIVVIRFAVERRAGVALPGRERRADGQPENDDHEE